MKSCAIKKYKSALRRNVDLSKTDHVINVLQELILSDERTYTEIAQDSALTTSTVQRIACGTTKSPHNRTVVHLFRAFDLNVIAVK